jgi:dTDP-4-amino-4,6-dideoxygalactose transaminase/ribosomal protein S18 acetylase RimI-like enzyme
MTELIPLFKVFMQNDHTDLINVLNSGMITQGSKVEEFESLLKKYFGHEYILTLNSATSGLTLALRMLKDKNNNFIIHSHNKDIPLTGFNAPYQLSPELANLLELDFQTGYSRVTVIKLIQKYIKDNKLFEKNISTGKRELQLDDKLKLLLGVESTHYFKLQTLLTPHFLHSINKRILTQHYRRDTILTSALTCTATNWPILANDFKIKWVDVDTNTCNMDLDDLESKIDYNTRAILLVHWAGTPVDINRLHQIRNAAELRLGMSIPIIQDCAHAFGAKYNDKFLGTHGDVCVFSLQAIKHLTCGDGGLIFLPDKEQYDRAKLLRWFGISREKRSGTGTDFRLEENIKEWGYKFHMNDINACIGINNLPHIEDNLTKIRRNAEYYNTHLHPSVKLTVPSNCVSSYWIYTIKVTNPDEFRDYMNSYNVVTSSVHTRNDKHSCVSQFQTPLPNLDELEQSFISIPVGWWINPTGIEYITNLVNKYVYENLEQLAEENKEHLQINNKIEIIELTLKYKTQYLDLIEELINIKRDVSDEYFNYFLENTNKYGNKIYLAKNISFDKIVGTIKIFTEPKTYDNVGHIEDVVVNKEYRNRGVATKLLQHVITEFQSTNCYKVVLNCKPELIPFYTKIPIQSSDLFENKFINEGNQMVYRFK